MPTRYLVTYDIAYDARRTQVYKTRRGYGDHLQYAAFRRDLAPTARAKMTADLPPLIDHGRDQLLVIDLAHVDGRADTCIVSIGRRYLPPERTVIVL